jgi:type IV secretion system protein TrbF
MAAATDPWRAWDDRYADHVIAKHNWQIVAILLIVAVIAEAFGLCWFSSRVRYLVYAVQVDKMGFALTQAQPLTPAADADAIEKMARFEVALFVRDLRSVSSDRAVEQRMLTEAYDHTAHDSAASHLIDDYFHANNAALSPFVVAQKQTVTVDIDAILRLSPQTYQVRWTEHHVDLNGAAVGAAQHFEAQLQTELVPPADANNIISNPIGFYVSNISWTQEGAQS